MVPGTILFDPKFRFKDGNTGSKLFIVLNDGRGGAYLTVKTTSNDTRYTVLYGCQAFARHPHFYLPLGCCCLTEHTWLCLEEFYEFEQAELHRRVISGEIHRIGVLTPELTNEVMGCAINCDDIPTMYATELRDLRLELMKTIKSC